MSLSPISIATFGYVCLGPGVAGTIVAAEDVTVNIQEVIAASAVGVTDANLPESVLSAEVLGTTEAQVED